MEQTNSLWRNKAFILRLGLSYALVPLLPPVLLLLWMMRSRPAPPGDSLGLILVYGAFGFAAMVLFGTPLLVLYLRTGWTGFLPFAAAGALCAFVTAGIVMGLGRNTPMVVFFGLAGLICGVAFRTILFGLHPPTGIGKITASKWSVPRVLLATSGAAFAAAFLFFLYSISDEHRSVTEQMGWQCVSVEDTNNPRFRHVEVVKMWFLRNPHYEERASGPHLCSELEAARQGQIAVTFDVWGNRVKGLHGYNGTGISVGSRRLEIYEFGSGGFHGDPAYGNYNSADHPEVYRFPLEVFK